MGKVILKSLLIIFTIVICALLGTIIRNRCAIEYSYLIGWIFGCLTIALCDIIEALFK